MGGPPLNCSQSAACIGSCLSELPNSPSVSSCRAADLQCGKCVCVCTCVVANGGAVIMLWLKCFASRDKRSGRGHARALV